RLIALTLFSAGLAAGCARPIDLSSGKPVDGIYTFDIRTTSGCTPTPASAPAANGFILETDEHTQKFLQATQPYVYWVVDAVDGKWVRDSDWDGPHQHVAVDIVQQS